MLAVSAGIISVGFWPDLLSWIPVLILTSFLFCLAAVLSRFHRDLAGLLSLAGCLLAGICWHLYQAEQRVERRLPTQLEGQDLRVQGYIASIPEQRPVGQRFQFVIEHADSGFSGRKILLNSYGALRFKAGERWQLQVRLRRPHGTANPGTFDFEGWLFQQQIAATGYVRSSSYNAPVSDPIMSLLVWRASIRERLLAVSEGLPFQSVLLALTLGDRNLLTDEQWEVFSNTGTNHLVVISGLHVALVAGLLALLVSRGWRLNGRLVALLPAQQAGAVVAICGALGYAAMAGFALPTQRAAIMVIVFVASRLLAVNLNSWFSFLLAMLLVLLLDPVAATGPGFWLSFSAVAALLTAYRNPVVSRVGIAPKTRLLKLVVPQLAVFVGLLVPLGHWQGQVSLLAPLANLIAIPVVSWLVVPFSLLAAVAAPLSPMVSGALFELANWIFSWLYQFLGLLPGLPGIGDAWSSNPLPYAIQWVAATGCVLLLLPGFASSRLLGLLLLSPLFSSAAQPTAEGVLEMHVLDVGQGLAVIVRTPKHSLVYDAGPRFSSGFDSGTAVVLPVLRRLGVERIGLLVASHADNDHAGGVAGLSLNMRIDRILAGEELADLPVPAEQCHRGQSWQWDGIDFRFLHPPETGGYRGNNASCVLLISAGAFQLLLPGDIDAGVERQLLREFLPDDNLEVLVSAHHGSNTSSGLSFLATIRPQLVIHSAGYRNQFGHPSSRVTERISRFGAVQLATPDSGMVSVVVQDFGADAEIRRYRDRFKRYWHWSKSERRNSSDEIFMTLSQQCDIPQGIGEPIGIC
jgi:competence protein ComEC